MKKEPGGPTASPDHGFDPERSLTAAMFSPVVFLYLLLGTVTILVGVLTAGALLYMYWIEVVLLYRTYQSKDETLGGKAAPRCL